MVYTCYADGLVIWEPTVTVNYLVIESTLENVMKLGVAIGVPS
jgi:hypothetical protein